MLCNTDKLGKFDEHGRKQSNGISLPIFPPKIMQYTDALPPIDVRPHFNIKWDIILQAHGEYRPVEIRPSVIRKMRQMTFSIPVICTTVHSG